MARIRSAGALALLGLGWALLVPASAGATLVFTRNDLNPSVFAASDTGNGIHRVGAGNSPHISPDGQTIVYLRGRNIPEMVTVAADGGKTRLLMKNWREPFDFDFSPNSNLVAAERGHELGKRKLVVIDLATGRQTVVAQGYFNGFSFSPDGREVVYSKSGKSFSLNGDLFRVGVGGGRPVALTHDHKSTSPLWSPDGRIVFDRVRNLKSPVGPKAQLYVMNANGGAVRQLTHTKVAPLLFGLSPVAFSANGRRLLAEFGGQDTTYAVTVNPRTGAERKVIPGDMEMGFLGTAISKDGKQVLGVTSVEPGPRQHIATVPYGGGPRRVIVASGFEPDWSR
jgi:dipeptidyl aminopeptidase/acylaminoacyl peptidase